MFLIEEEIMKAFGTERILCLRLDQSFGWDCWILECLNA